MIKNEDVLIIPPFEESGEEDASKRERITNVSSLEELYQVLSQIKTIKGTAREYDAKKLIEDIEEVKSGDRMLGYITRTYGLRDKVGEILGIKE